MTFLRKKTTTLIILCVLIASAWFRLTWYGDLRLSVGNPETSSYIAGSKAPVWSWQIFAGKRLFTTNLIFKVANDEKNCPMQPFSAPAAGKETKRFNQPCFDKIVLLQNFLSVFAWCFLAWMTARQLKSPPIKIASALVVVLFGFTPQIAEWDSVLSPESLSLSMFAISLGLLMELAFRVSASQTPFASKSNRALFAAMLIIFLLWVFVRDVHLYAIPMFFALVAPFIFIKKFSGVKQIKATLALLLAFFVIGFLSAKDSLRATYYPVVNAIDFYILPYPQRAEFFKQFDMPERSSPDYQSWADVNASKVYGLFLISHPGFIVATLWEYMPHFTSDFEQPYFTLDMKYRDSLLKIGEFVHPQTAAVFLVDFLLLFALCVHAVRRRDASLIAWAWLAAWFLLIAAITLFLSFFGDIYGTRRHIMPSAELFRLFMWIFLFPLLDYSSEETSSI